MDNETSNFLYHTNCPQCGSSDANSVYDDGHTYCFKCNTTTAGGNDTPKRSTYKSTSTMRELLRGEFKPLSKRGIPLDICRQYNYTVGQDINGNSCQIATYYDKDNNPVAQKIRYPDKTFKFIGDTKKAVLYGQQLFGNGLKITITEGEIDALSVATAFKGKYPVVSIPNGASGAKKAIAKELDWLSTFDEIYLWFDSDEAGKKALEECISILPAGKVKVISLPTHKDANELLLDKGEVGVVEAFYKAKSYRPDGIIQAIELLEEAVAPVEYGLPWMFEGINNVTYGRRLGELHLLGAGVGIGKTDFIMNQLAYDIMHGITVGTFMLEQKPVETIKRIAGKIDGKLYHLPNTTGDLYDTEKLKETIRKINDTNNLYIYDNFGSIEWDVIQDKIRYMVHNYGVQVIYLDNITAITAQASDERRFLDGFMEELASIAKELNIYVLAVSHLNAPTKGASHEEGGRVEAKQFTGSRAIMRWSFNMYGLERNNQHPEPPERQKMIFRILKDRYSGQSTGKTFSFRYDNHTGLLREVDEEWVTVESDTYTDNTEDF